MFTCSTLTILTLFDFCGFSTEYFQSPKYRRFRNIIFIFHIILVVVVTGHFGRIQQYFRNTEIGRLNAFNEYTQYSLLLASYWIILIESFVQRKNQRIFWRIYGNCELNSDAYNNQWFLVKVLEYLLISCAANTIAIYMDIVPRDLWIAFMIPGYVNHFRIFFYVLQLELIQSKLQIIEKELSMYRMDQNIHFFRGFQQKYREMCALIVNVNETYSISHLSTLMSQLYFFYSNVNWGYLHFGVYTGFYMTSMYSSEHVV